MSPQTLSRGRRALAGGTVAALTAGLLALSPQAAQAADTPAGPHTVTGGTISWGVKQSWRNYLKMPFVESTTTAIAPATDDTSTTTFADAEGVWKSGDFSISAAGGVRFEGHHGALDLTLSNPTLVREGSTTHLLVDAVDSDEIEHDAIAIADVDLDAATITKTGTTLTIAGATTTLTEDGTGLFANGGVPFYPAGAELSPLNLTLDVIGSPQVSVSKTEVFTDETATVTVTGSGFDPATATGTRPPLSGKPAGSYVVIGYFADDWRPSTGAASSVRKVVSQKWAVPAASIATIGGAGSGAIELKPDGTFETTFQVNKAQLDTVAAANPTLNGKFGVYTYPGSGATNADYETFTPITFVKHDSAVTVAAPPVEHGQDATVTVSGLSEGATGTLTLTGAGDQQQADVADGGATFTVSGLAAGSYGLTVAYSGDADHEATTNDTTTLVVRKVASAALSATGFAAQYGKGGTVTITAPAAGTVTVPGLGAATTKAAGKVSFSVPKTQSVGSRRYVVSFAPADANVAAPGNVVVTVTITKAAAAKPTVKVNKKPTSKKAGKVTVRVKGVAGAATPTGKVTIRFTKGKSVKTKTFALSKGSRTVAVPKLKKGTWKITVRYTGDSRYAARAYAAAGKVKVTK